MTDIAKISAGLVLALLPLVAQGHYPVLDCYRQGEKVLCMAGYSDGTTANEELIQVLDYQDQELFFLISDAEGMILFSPPEQDFYVRYDPQHEEPAEFDHGDL